MTEVIGLRTLARPRRRTASRSTWRRFLLGFTGILLFLVSWQLIPALGIVNPLYLPSATAVLSQVVANAGAMWFWVAVAETMWAWFLGLLIATTAALVLGFIIGPSRFLRRATNSTVEFLRPIPSVALIPVAVLLFGIQIGSSLMLIVYAAFWQIFIQVLYGVADVDPVAKNTARSFGLGSPAVWRHVVFPTALPYLITGLRLASAVALILAITTELIVGSPGIGHEIALAQSGGATTSMYALVVAAGLIGMLLNSLMRLLERRTLAWHSSVRAEAIV
ncbi:MAG TPA: ABC transporter permease [Microbacterium sp.]|nr:ABC transporter permease [Microbacterium sp.]